MMRFPGKGAPGAILGPQNALIFIRFNRGRRHGAARSTFSMKFRLFHGGKHIFTPVPETLGLPTFLIGVLDIVDLKMHKRCPRGPFGASKCIKFH